MSDRLAMPSDSSESSFSGSHRFAVALIAILSSFAVVIAYCLPGVIGEARADANCAAGGAVVIVAGTNDPDASDMSGVKQRYEGTGRAHNNGNAKGDYDIIYVDYPTTLWPMGAVGYDDDVARGTAATKSAIAGYQSSCPGSPVKVVGYSQGARVAGDVLSDIGNDRDDKDIVATDKNGDPLLDENGDPVIVDDISSDGLSGELYSDPRQNGDKTGRGIEQSLIGVIPGLTMTGPREGGFGDIPVTSVCAEGDPICDLPDPLYDPIGALDGLVGYFTKHGYYPFHMYQDPASWTNKTCTTSGSTTTCEIKQSSAIVGLLRQGATAIGLDGALIPDFIANRPTIGLPFGIELAKLQPAIRLVSDLLPPLPKLGYGGYLPDVFVFQKIIEGIVKLAPDQFKTGVKELAASVKSIVLMPVNFVKYWAGQIVTAGPTITSGVTPFSTTEVAGDDPDPAETASLRKAVTVLSADQGTADESASSSNDTVVVSSTVDDVADNNADNGQGDNGQGSTIQDVPKMKQPEKQVVKPTPGSDESGDGNGGDGSGTGQQDQNGGGSTGDTENTEDSTTTTDNGADDSTSNSETSKSGTSKSGTSKSGTSNSTSDSSNSSDTGSGNSGSGNGDSDD
ncbi:cutinase family protein [Gordonia bronchialis]|uniref:cutinase family protein n=1 Tax=Gordonia bronchialis TaxID=2054 RepID=UPI00242C624B|nr:PE-PPE domain-containing protein [Gordonia bronchialis]